MGWLGSWTKRKPVTISRASGAVVNYQMKVLVGESSGAVGEFVDCEALCKTDFSDLRFTAADGVTVLDYWIETVSGTSPNQLATVWVEFDAIGTSATTFYMYYGNSGAAAVSSGVDTFISFDDFERGVDGDTVGGSWTEITPHVHLSTTQKYNGSKSCRFGNNATASVGSFPVPVSSDISIRYRIYKDTGADANFCHGDSDSTFYITWSSAGELKYYSNTPGEYLAIGSVANNAWNLLEINNFDYANNTQNISLNDVLVVANGKQDLVEGTYGLNILRVGSGITGYVYLDEVIVRNFRTVEPAMQAFGTGEDSGIIPLLTVAPALFTISANPDITVDVPQTGAGPYIFLPAHEQFAFVETITLSPQAFVAFGVKPLVTTEININRLVVVETTKHFTMTEVTL